MFQGIEYFNDISLENIKKNLLLKIENISKQGARDASIFIYSECRAK